MIFLHPPTSYIPNPQQIPLPLFLVLPPFRPLTRNVQTDRPTDRQTACTNSSLYANSVLRLIVARVVRRGEVREGRGCKLANQVEGWWWWWSLQVIRSFVHLGVAPLTRFCHFGRRMNQLHTNLPCFSLCVTDKQEKG